MKMKTKHIVQGAIIAGIYAVLTMFIAPFFSYGVMQVRIAEALTILPVLTPVAVPGLFVGCFIANLLSPVGLVDVVLGSGATLIAAVMTRKLRNKKWLAPLPPVIVNGLVIGPMLYYYYGVKITLLGCIAWVSLGQGIVCYGLGIPLMNILKKYKGHLK